MEPKIIIYIVVGILYFLYSIQKKAQEKKRASGTSEDTSPTTKPVSPPSSNPLDDIIREMTRKQAEAQGRAILPTLQPTQVVTKKKPKKETLIQEMKKAAYTETTSDIKSSYDLDLKEMESKQKGIYHIKTLQEEKAQTNADADSSSYSYEFDARQAFIGSLIFERKY